MRGRVNGGRRPVLGTVAVLAGAVLAGGFAGSAAALWSDSETVTGGIGTGSVLFAVGRGSELTHARGPEEILNVTLGAADAAALVDTGELAVPIRVDALAQGNLGLRYEAQPPRPAADSILGAAELTLVQVPDAERCTPGASGSHELGSTPVDASYTDGTTPVTEHWCLLGRLDAAPLAGAYSNTGTVHADSEYGPVSDSDTWTANVRRNPAHEPEVTLGFVHETFRPGG